MNGGLEEGGNEEDAPDGCGAPTELGERERREYGEHTEEQGREPDEQQPGREPGLEDRREDGGEGFVPGR